RFLSHVRPAPPPGRSLGAREVRTPGGPGPRRVVERRGSVRRPARAEHGAGRILPPRVRRVRGQARPRRGVRRWHPRRDARRRGRDGDWHRPVGEVACGGVGARPALGTDHRLPPRHRRRLGRCRPRRDFRPRVRGGRAGAHRRSERNLPRLGPPDALTVARSWVEAILATGVVPASYVPEASVGRTDLEEFTGADPVEDPELQVHSLAGAHALAPAAVGFLDGIEQWRVVGYAGVTPIVRAHVAAAIRLRGADRRPRTIAEAAEELAITRLDHLPAAVRAALEGTGVSVVEISAEDAGQPARALPAARIEVQRARAALERRLAERQLSRLGADEWLVVDGVLSDS